MRILITYILINCEWFIIKLCGIGIILLTDLLCGITSYNFSVDLRFDCIFKKTTKIEPHESKVFHSIISSYYSTYECYIRQTCTNCSSWHDLLMPLGGLCPWPTFHASVTETQNGNSGAPVMVPITIMSSHLTDWLQGGRGCSSDLVFINLACCEGI